MAVAVPRVFFAVGAVVSVSCASAEFVGRPRRQELRDRPNAFLRGAGAGDGKSAVARERSGNGGSEVASRPAAPYVRLPPVRGRQPVRFPAGHGYFGADVRPDSASDRLAGRRMSRTAASCRSEIRTVRVRDVRKGTTGARKSRSKKRASDRLDRFRWVALRDASSCVVPYGPGSVRGSAVFRDEAGRTVAGRFSGVFALSVHGTCRTVERGMPWCGKCGSTDGPEILRRANGRATIESRYRGTVSLGSRSGFGRIVGRGGRRFGRKSGGCGSRNRFSRYAVSSAGICNGVNGV